MGYHLYNMTIFAGLIVALFPSLSVGTLVGEYRDAKEAMERGFGLIPAFQQVLVGEESPEPLDLHWVVSVYNRAIDREPHNPWYHFALGEAYRLGGSSEADRYYLLSLRKVSGRGGHLLLIELFENRGLDSWADDLRQKLLELKLDSGASSLPLLSSHFRDRGTKYVKEGDLIRGRRALEFAQELDPFQFENHLSLLKLSIRERKWGRAMGAAISMVTALRGFQNQSAVLSLLLLQLSLAVPLGLVVGFWGIFFRLIPSMQHLVFENIPTRVPLLPRVVGSWAVLAAPLLLGLPVYLFTLFAIALVWTLLSRRERALVSLLLLSLIVSPLISRAYYLLRSPRDFETQSHLLSLVQLSPWESGLEKRLASQASQSGDFASNFSLGLLRKRRGDFSGAKKAYEAALLVSPRNSLVHNNLGNVYFATGDYAKATELYEKAINEDPKKTIPHYNLAQVYLKTLRFREQTAELEKASELNFGLVRSLTDRASEHFNRAVADETLSTKLLWQMVFRQFWKWESLRNSPFRDISFSAAGFLVLALLLSRFATRREFGLRCALCGRPICPRCRGTFGESWVCPSCEWRVSGTQSEDIQKRFMEKITRRAAILARVEGGVLSFLYPGTGHFFSGAFGRGLFFSLFASLVVSRLFLIDLAQAKPPILTPWSLDSGQTLLVGILGLIWVWSLVSLLRRKETLWPSKETWSTSKSQTSSS